MRDRLAAALIIVCFALIFAGIFFCRAEWWIGGNSDAYIKYVKEMEKIGIPPDGYW